MTRKTLGALAICATLALSASACSRDLAEGEMPPAVSPKGAAESANVEVFTVTLPDGREVLCVWRKAYRAGGLSCDWENAS